MVWVSGGGPDICVESLRDSGLGLVSSYTTRKIFFFFQVFILLPILVFLCAIYLVVAPFYDYPKQSTYCLIFILSGTIFWALFVKWKVLPQCCFSCFDAFTYKIQMWANLSMPSGEGEEGEEMTPPEIPEM